MAKQSGLGWTTLSVDDSSGTAQDIRNDITNFQFATPRAVQDVTGVDKSAIERILLLADFSITLNGVFNEAANMSHEVFCTPRRVRFVEMEYGVPRAALPEAFEGLRKVVDRLPFKVIFPVEVRVS